MSSKKLPPKNDPERAAVEKEVLEVRDKTEEVVGAIKEGKLPTTEQITQTIDKIQESEAIHDAGYGMTPLGKRVLADTEKVLDTTKKVLSEKNSGDELQNIVYFGIQGAKDISAESDLVSEDLQQKIQNAASTTQKEAPQTIQDAFKKMIKIPNLIMSNSEFRLLINEFNSIIQEAITINIPKNSSDTSDYNNENRISKDPKETTKETAKDTAQQLREGVYPAAKTAAELGGEHIKDFSKGKKSFKEAVTDSAKTLQNTIQESVNSYELSEEQRNRLVTRFKNVMIQTHKSPEFQDTISELIEMLSQISQHTQEITKQVSENLTETTPEIINNNEAIKIATQYTKEFVENLANHCSLNPLIESLKELGKRVQTDKKLHDYLKDLKSFVLKSLYDTEFVQNNDYINNGSELVHTGREILLKDYHDITQKIQQEINDFNEALQYDRTLSEWTKDLDILINDLFLDEKGRPTIKYELVKDFAKIIPILNKKFKYLPLPRIENEDENYDYAFDNIVLHLPEILPKHLHINLTSEIHLDREIDNMIQNNAIIEVSKLRTDARNIAFFYKKKKGVFNMMDVGFIDFAIPDDGLGLYIKLFLDLPTEERPYLLLNILEAKATIQTLKLRLHDTQHDFLYSILNPLIENKIKQEVENLITEKLKSAVEYAQESIQRFQSKVSELQQNTNLNLINDNVIMNTITGDKEDQQNDQEKLKFKEAWKSEAFNPDTTADTKYSKIHDREFYPMEE